MRPTQLLREMKDLAGNEMNDNLLKSVWMGRLPPNVRTITSISNDPLDKLEIFADKIMEVSDSRSLDAISVPQHAHLVQSTLEQQINLLVKEVAELKTTPRKFVLFARPVNYIKVFHLLIRMILLGTFWTISKTSPRLDRLPNKRGTI